MAPYNSPLRCVSGFGSDKLNKESWRITKWSG